MIIKADQLSQNPFEVCKNGWIVECPFRIIIVVPFIKTLKICDSHPIFVYIEISAVANMLF